MAEVDVAEIEEELDVLRERRDWLAERIGAKTRLGWDTEWDEREHRALSMVLVRLREEE